MYCVLKCMSSESHQMRAGAGFLSGFQLPAADRNFRMALVYLEAFRRENGDSR